MRFLIHWHVMPKNVKKTKQIVSKGNFRRRVSSVKGINGDTFEVWDHNYLIIKIKNNKK